MSPFVRELHQVDWFSSFYQINVSVGLQVPYLGRIIFKSKFMSSEYAGCLHRCSTGELQCSGFFCWVFFLINLFYFIYFGLCWVFVAAHGLSLVAASWGYTSLQCAGFSLRWLLLLRSTGSRHAGFSSCSWRAQLLCGMWDLPGPGLEPSSPALAGGFLTTAPPGKPQWSVFKIKIQSRKELIKSKVSVWHKYLF